MGEREVGEVKGGCGGIAPKGVPARVACLPVVWKMGCGVCRLD